MSVPEPVDMTDQELARVYREQYAELSRIEDELEVVPAGHAIRGQVEFVHAVTVEIVNRLRAEIKSRKALYAAVAEAIGDPGE